MPSAPSDSTFGAPAGKRGTAPVESVSHAGAESVRVHVDKLIDGRKLFYPIHDCKGVLLLAAGATITDRFKGLLRARGIQEVMLHKADAGSIPESPPVELPPASQPPAGVALNPELTARLDELVDSGRLFTAQSGPPFKERLVAHGCTGYDPEQRGLLLKRHSETCALLDGLIKSAVHGAAVPGEKIAAVVASYLADFCQDADCVLDVANQARGFAALAEQALHTSLLGMALAIEMGMGEDDIRTVGLSGLVHDWGMTRIPEETRNANRILSHAEFEEIRRHPLYTLEMLQRMSGLPPLVPLICYQVHEQPDGGGYPRGRRKEEIHPGAQILHVADAYSALTAPRPFRLALTPYAAVECLLRNARDKLVDAEVVRALLNVISLFPIGSYVLLDDTSMGRVIRRNGNQFSAPLVQLVRRSDGTRVDPAHDSVIVDTSADNRKIVRALPTPGRQETTLRPELQTLQRS
jgi:hypothetical protein